MNEIESSYLLLCLKIFNNKVGEFWYERSIQYWQPGATNLSRSSGGNKLNVSSIIKLGSR